jgi:predicted metal-dependent HD superfamily phosphohydrolase
MKGYYKLRRKAFEILRTQLPKELYYHGINHTLNVLKTCNNYIKREKVEKRNAKLLRIGVILHDIGFTVSKIEHEKTGKDLAIELMGTFGFSQKDIRIVQGLILATRIPQSPKNELEKIICDCDLDYLGRSDFYPISDHLYKELKTGGMVQTKSDWNKIQIKFLQNHRYHTDFAIKNRQPEKEKRIAELLQLESKT